jgi:hypothetical protein
VAIALLALPVSVLAEHLEDETADHVSDILISTVTDPAYVWDGRLAASYSALVADPVSTPAYVWDPAEQAAMVRDHFLLEHASE